MAMPAIRRRWTAADVRDLIQEDRAWPRYELIDGELLVIPAPGSAHQIAVFELAKLLDAFLDETGIGLVLTSPADIELKPDTIMQPDVFVVPSTTAIAGEILQWPDIKSLHLAVEILSPSSSHTDRTTKRDFYLDHDVAEYWIVDLEGGVIERWTPRQTAPELHRDSLVWQPRTDTSLDIDVRTFFGKVARKARLTSTPRTSDPGPRT